MAIDTSTLDHECKVPKTTVNMVAVEAIAAFADLLETVTGEEPWETGPFEEELAYLRQALKEAQEADDGEDD